MGGAMVQRCGPARFLACARDDKGSRHPDRLAPPMASRDLQRILIALRSQGATRDDLSVEESRRTLAGLVRVCPTAADVRIEPVELAGVPAEWLSCPEARDDAVLIYLHGGAYILGGLPSYRDLASRLGRAARARVLSVDYRLAPEHPFPAAVEDAFALYRAVLEAGVSPARLALAGDSAGGALVLSTLLQAREHGLALPAALALLSPLVDLEGRGDSMTTRAALDPVIQFSALRRSAELYLAGQDPRHPLASPLHGNLAGLPPMLVQVGTAETLFDDATRLVTTVARKGGEVSLDVWPGMFHVWQLYARLLPEGRQAIERAGAFLAGYIKPSFSTHRRSPPCIAGPRH